MIIMMALVLTIVRLLVARIHTAFFPRVLARFMDLAVLLVGAVELRLIITAVLAVVSFVITAVIPAAGLLAAVAQPAVVSTMAVATTTIIVIALARGTAVTASVPSNVALMAVG